MLKTILKISFSCRLLVIALMNVEVSDSTWRCENSREAAVMIPDLTASASAIRDEATGSCISVPCCISLDSSRSKWGMLSLFPYPKTCLSFNWVCWRDVIAPSEVVAAAERSGQANSRSALVPLLEADSILLPGWCFL